MNLKPFLLRLPEAADQGNEDVLPRDLSIQIIPTLGTKICKYDLHWAIWIPGGSFATTPHLRLKLGKP